MGLPARKQVIEQLVEAHYQSLYRYAYRLSGSAAEAEDLTQDTFCQAQAKLNQLLDRERVKPWLYSILRNSYLHRLRKQKQEKLVAWENFEDIAEAGEESAGEIDPEQLKRALAELPEPFRTPLVLYFFDDFSYRDIAEQMDLPMGTVMSRLSRAKAFLRMRLLAAPKQAAVALGRQADGL